MRVEPGLTPSTSAGAPSNRSSSRAPNRNVAVERSSGPHGSHSRALVIRDREPELRDAAEAVAAGMSKPPWRSSEMAPSTSPSPGSSRGRREPHAIVHRSRIRAASRVRRACRVRSSRLHLRSSTAWRSAQLRERDLAEDLRVEQVRVADIRHANAGLERHPLGDLIAHAPRQLRPQLDLIGRRCTRSRTPAPSRDRRGSPRDRSARPGCPPNGRS